MNDLVDDDVRKTIGITMRTGSIGRLGRSDNDIIKIER
jgi:hypothetical protein